MAGRPAILLLAAGASRRMRGADKLREDVGGRPLLQVMCARALATGLPVYVTLPGPDHPRGALISAARPVYVADAAEGMGASIRAGVAALPGDVAGVMILPADMPGIRTPDLSAMADTFAATQPPPILRATSVDGRPGHPVLFPADLFPNLVALQGDSGARPVLRAYAGRVAPVALAGTRALDDLDSPEDWAAWRARGQDT